MNTLLLVTKELRRAKHLKEVVAKTGFEIKHVTQLKKGLDSARSLHYKVVILDLEIAEEAELKAACTQLWKDKPMTVLGVYSKTPSYTPYSLQIIGVRQYLGDDATEMLEVDLEQLSSILDEPGTNSILYVEDLDAPRFIVGSMMESFGLGSVTAASSADEALEHLEKNLAKFFCVVSDFNMPNKNGLWLLKKIRNTPHLSSIPVILVTAYGTQENLLDCVTEGVTGFLVKPPRKDQLKAELSKAKRLFLNGLSPRLAHPESAKEVRRLLAGYDL